MDDKIFMTIGEASKYLGIKKQTLYGLIRNSDKFPARKIGKSWYIHRGCLDAWCTKVVK